MNKNLIGNMMIDYAIKNWKSVCYDSERQEVIEEITEETELKNFIKNLEEDIENDSTNTEALELLELVRSLVINSLYDYLTDNGLKAKYIPDETGETFGQLEINEKRYPISMTLSDEVTDEFCNMITIDGTEYHFAVDMI